MIEELVATVSETEKVNIKPLFNIEKDGSISDFLKKLYAQFYEGLPISLIILTTELFAISLISLLIFS